MDELETKSGLSGPVACEAHRATTKHVSCPLSTENGAMNLYRRIFTQKKLVNREFGDSGSYGPRTMSGSLKLSIF